MLKELRLQRIPSHLAPLLSAACNRSLEGTTEIADDIMSCYSPSVSALNILVPQSHIPTFTGQINNLLHKDRRVLTAANSRWSSVTRSVQAASRQARQPLIQATLPAICGKLLQVS